MSIKDFDIIQELGKGAFGTVYKVRRIKDNQIYALKKVIMNKLKQKEKENSLNEIRILASISHQNIVAYKDAFYDQELFALCIVTEFADDGDLEKKINDHIKKKTNFSETQIFSIFIQILNGLKSLHDQKIMHRDIKAANMLLFKDGFVKIGDMNVSKVIKNGLMNTQTGTPYYASPEVWNNKPYDCKSDIWSLGCLLYEMTTLRAPFRGNSMKNLFEKVMKGTYDPISNFYSKNLSEIIKSMLMLNPQLRPDCDAILKMICKKINHISFNFPLEYEANANGQNYFKNFKNEIEGKNDFTSNNNNNNNENRTQFRLVDNYNNRKNDEKRDNEFEKQTQNELLQTIKIPKKLNEINNMLPKSNYRKKIISTSGNYEATAKSNNISLPGVLNKSANENNNLNISKEININRNASKILNDLRTNYRPISSDHRPKNIEKNSDNHVLNKSNNEGKNNSPNSGQIYQRMNPSPNNYISNNFNKRNVTHINNPLRNVVNNKTPIIVNQISSKIDKINIVNCNVELLEKLANLNNLTDNNGNPEINTKIEEKGSINSQNKNLDLSFNTNNNELAHENNKISHAGIKNNSSLTPIKQSNIGNFYMKKNMDKITSLKIQKNEEIMQNNLTKKLNNLNNIDKQIQGNSDKSLNEVIKSEANNEASSDKNHSRRVLDPLTLNLDKNIKLKRVPPKNIDLNNLEDIQNTIKQSQNELNMILNRNFINEYVPFNAKSTKNKNRVKLYANRNFIVSAEKNGNDLANQEKQNMNTEANEESVVYLNTDIYNNKDRNIHVNINNSVLDNRKNLINSPTKNKFNNIKIDIENNVSKKDPGCVNGNDTSHHQIQTDFEQKSKSSLDKEIEENIVSSLSKSSKKVVSLNSIKEITNNKGNLGGKSIQEALIEKTIKNPLNENISQSHSQKRLNSAIPRHHKNNSNNIKMILNPCHVEERNLKDFNKQISVEISNTSHVLSPDEANAEDKDASPELKRVHTYEEQTPKTVQNQMEKQENLQTDYNKININNQYCVDNLYNEPMDSTEQQVKNRIFSANQKIPISLVEQHNLKANYLKNQLKIKKNPFSNSKEKLKNNQDFPTINNNSVNVSGNKKNKENLVAYAKFVQLRDRNSKNTTDESININNNNNNNKVYSRINNPRTPNNFTIKRIDLNLNLPIEGREADSNFSSKHNNIPKIINNRNSVNVGGGNLNRSRLKANLKNFSQEKSLFANKNNNNQQRNSPLLDNRVASRENDKSFFANREIDFNNSKMNNFDYSFMEKKSKDNSQSKLEMPNISSNNVSKNKSSYLLKSEDHSYIIKNVDNIYNTYENYEDGDSNKKEFTPLPKIPKYYGTNIGNGNGKKLRINLPGLKKDLSQNSNYGLSPMSNPHYTTNIKDRIVNLSTNDNLITNPSYNYLNTSSNNRSNHIDKTYKYSPINASVPVANLFWKKTPVNNFTKDKKIEYVNAANQ